MNKFFLTLYFTVCVLSADGLNRKIVLKNLENKDQNSQRIAEKFETALKSKLVEFYGDQFQILDADDLKSFKDKSSIVSKFSCHSEECSREILAGLNADELIFGSVSREGDQIRLSLKNLNRTDGQLKIKSELNELFTDTELLDSHYLSETVKKLGNPKYTVQRISLAETGGMGALKKLKIEPESASIQDIDFKSTDDKIARLVSILQPDLDKGDTAYKEKKYDLSIEAYSGILKKITEKLTSDKQAKMKNYSDSIRSRLQASFTGILRHHLIYIDERIEECYSAKNCNLNEMYEWVESGVKWQAYIPKEMAPKFLEFKPLLDSRRNALNTYSAGIFEEEGNESYRQLDFENALVKYEQSKKALEAVSDKSLKDKLMNKLELKIKTTHSSGRKYLRNRVQLLLDEVEELNLMNKDDDARSRMDAAADAVLDSKFQTEEVFTAYNKVGKIMKIPKLSKNSKRTKLASKIRKGKVTAGVGLFLRMAPSRNGIKLYMLPTGETVDILHETSVSEVIDGLSGKWLKVQHKGKAGYVFGGYISTE